MALFDLASLTKPLVTAPLALKHLDLDADQREPLGFSQRPEPLTVRQLLSHSAGLPPWLPYTGVPLARQLAAGFPVGSHPLLQEARVGASTYSDLGFRLLAELLEHTTQQPFDRLGAAFTGLVPAPYPEAPQALPEGPDAVAWRLAAPHWPLPPMDSRLPHDANARAGMRGHAGFGGTPGQIEAWVRAWLKAGWPRRMAVDVAQGTDTRWGLGLQRLPEGIGRLGSLLAQVPPALQGVYLSLDLGCQMPAPAPEMHGEPRWDGAWWYHFGYTGCALFVRPETEVCVVLLLHRRGPAGELLDAEALRARRWALLSAWVRGLVEG